jgi:uncharacterized membrane protein YhaH (DUF805 family)
MDWNWFLFSFEGRINRAKFWHAALIWFATIFSFMTIFMWVVVGILRASGNDFHFVSSKTMHPAFYLLGFPLLVIFVWPFAATAIKRLHDRGKSGWWFTLFFVAPSLLNKLSDWLDNPLLATLVSALAFGLSVWCFVELFCLRGTKGPNRFGPDPLAPVTSSAPASSAPAVSRWDQHSALEFPVLGAGPWPGSHVKRSHD